MNTSVILGASAGHGRALSEELASRGSALFLVSSDLADLTPLASDLKLRFKVPVHVMAIDFYHLNPEDFKNELLKYFKVIDNVFSIAGLCSPSVDRVILSTEDLDRMLTVNLVRPIEVINSLSDVLRNSDHANLVGVGSIASSRPRRNNTIYATGKTGLEFYFQSLRHYFVGCSINVQFYRLGYMATQMTFGQKLLFPAADPKNIARIIVDNLGKDIGVRYLPFWWSYIMKVYQNIPWFLYKKMDM